MKDSEIRAQLDTLRTHQMQIYATLLANKSKIVVLERAIVEAHASLSGKEGVEPGLLKFLHDQYREHMQAQLVKLEETNPALAAIFQRIVNTAEGIGDISESPPPA